MHVVVDRALPPGLAAVLGAARRLEATAETTGQWHAAVHANSRLLLTAVNAGWMVTEIGRALGIDRHAASKRLQRARREFGTDDVAGLTVPQPPPRPLPVSPLAILHTPVEGRDWLSASEATTFAGVSYSCLTLWRKGGLLPSTRWLNPTQALYSRSDLNRILRAPRTRRGADHEAVLADIGRSVC